VDGTLTHRTNVANEFYKINLTVNGDVSVSATGQINIDDLGYSDANGPGQGIGGNDGGGYGGRGGDTGGGGYGETYGSITAPVNIGSGGQGGGGDGGGAVILTVTGTTTVDGTITASATSGSDGRGSGGSIYITTGFFTGTGTLRANGGDDITTDAAGGGGRIAVILTSAGANFSTFDVGGTITAYGGEAVGAMEDGAAGTIYRQTQAQGANNGILIIDNNNRDTRDGVYTTLDDEDVNMTVVGSLVIQNDAAFAIGNDDELTVGGTLNTLTMDVTGSFSVFGTLNLGGTTFTVPGTVEMNGTLSDVVYIGQDDDALVPIIMTNYGTLRTDNALTTFDFTLPITATNFIANTGSMTLTFDAASTFTVTSSLIMDGTMTNRVSLQSDTGGTRFNISVTGTPIVTFVDVSDSEALGTDIIANNSFDTTNNDSGEGSPQWVFGAIQVYRSVGTETMDMNTGGATVEIIGSTATFDMALNGTIGVGDILEYNPGSGVTLAVIIARTSSMIYTVSGTMAGSDPTAAAATTAVSIFRAYTSLSNWESQTENTSFDDTVENFDQSTDLTALNTVMNVACYADGTDTGVTIAGWTTSALNYIRIYTPVSTLEVGISQRHNGIWDTSAYHIQSLADSLINVQVENIRWHERQGIAVKNSVIIIVNNQCSLAAYLCCSLHINCTCTTSCKITGKIISAKRI